jgi:lysozyme
MSQSQFDAIVSFAFNVGEQALAKSTLLKKHLAGDYAGAAKEFARWTRGGGKVLAGLVKRRAAEAALYLA